MKKTVSLFVALAVATASFAGSVETPEASSSSVGVMKQGSTFKVFYKGTTQSDVKVSIVDSRNEVVYKEHIKKMDGFVRPYNFSELPAGDYTIIVEDQSGRHEEKVNLTHARVENLAHITRLNGEEHKYLLSVPNTTSEQITVNIYGDDNELVYSERQSVNGDFAKVYNMKQLSGKFLFVVKGDKATTKVIGN